MKQEITKLIEQERDGAFGVGVLEDKIHTIFKDKIREIVEDLTKHLMKYGKWDEETESLETILLKIKKIKE
jgi:hypothetical protein